MQLHYETLGSGEALVILHGLLGSGRNWLTLAKALAADYHVILPDARNHGRSAHAESMSYMDMATDVAELLTSLQRPAAHIIGHSMGGKTAMTLALHHPERLQSLTVLDIAPVTYHAEFDALLGQLLDLDLTNIRSRREANDALAAGIPEDNLRAFLLHNLSRQGDGYAWRIKLPLIRRQLATIGGFPDTTSRYTAPCLFLAGADSAYISAEHTDTLMRYFPNARVKRIADAGHWLHAEQPAAVLAAIRQCLAGGSPQ